MSQFTGPVFSRPDGLGGVTWHRRHHIHTAASERITAAEAVEVAVPSKKAVGHRVWALIRQHHRRRTNLKTEKEMKKCSRPIGHSTQRPPD